MINWLKKYFIPHETNEHKPHFLRGRSILIVIALIGVLELALLFPGKGIYRSDFFGLILPNVLIDDTNQTRTELSLNTLKSNELLQQAAQLKANDMAKRGYFSHNTPDGLTPWYWLEKVDYKYVYAGENLAVNFIDSNDVHQAWLNSPSHKANIVNKNYTEIGIATATGMYKGSQANFVVQFFGKPAKQNIAVASALLPTPKPSIVPTKTPASSQKPLVTKTPTPKPVVAAETTKEPEQPLLSQNEKTSYSSFTEKLASAPKTITKDLLMVIMGLVVVALILAIFIRIDIQHPSLILNAVIIIIILIGVIVLNQNISQIDIALLQ